MMNIVIWVTVTLIVAGLAYLFIKSRSLNKLIDLKIDLQNTSVNPGEELKYSVVIVPSVRINAEIIEGDLLAKQFNPQQGNLSNLPDMLFSGGEVLDTFIFSFGKDIVLLPGSENKFDGYVPIPETAIPTEKSALAYIRWILTVRVHSKGYKPATTSREIIVTSLSPQMMIDKKREEEQNVEFIPETRKGKGNSNIQILFPGSQGETSGNETHIKSGSSFGFLELENDK